MNATHKWELEPTSPAERPQGTPTLLRPESEVRPRWRQVIDRNLDTLTRGTRALALLGVAFALGFAASSTPEPGSPEARLRARLDASNDALSAREGELEQTRIELTRLNTVIANSSHYRIPADLAAKIYDIAVAEGIDPKIAYGLVRVESEFTNRAISSKGALGLTQVMPATARFFEPKLQRADLFDPETNLHIGFRFLKELIAKYDGDVDLALHAYNRGPGVVDKVKRRGGNPANGYARAVRSGGD
jgi:soluble lytic murein transglycosylase-like protein